MYVHLKYKEMREKKLQLCTYLTILFVLVLMGKVLVFRCSLGVSEFFLVVLRLGLYSSLINSGVKTQNQLNPGVQNQNLLNSGV